MNRGLSALLALPAVGALGWLHTRPEGPEWVYGIDDAYIHLSVARTFAETGVWGIHPLEPATASSSPLWSLLLAGLGALTRTWAPLPFVLNSVALVGLGALMGWRPGREPGRLDPLIGLVVMFIAGALSAAVTGMEHLPHAFVIVALSAAVVLKRWPWVAILAAVAVGTRLETAFFLAGVGVWLGVQGERRGFAAPALGGAAGLGAVIAHSWLAGGHLLPYSVTAKSSWFGATGAVDALERVALRLVHQDPLHAGALVAAVILAWSLTSPGGATRALVAGLATAAAAQLTFGWVALTMGRYEFWLVVVAGWVGLQDASLPRLKATTIGDRVVGGLGMATILARSWVCFGQIPGAVEDVYHQHIAMGRLVRDLGGPTVMANDIGTITFYGGGRVVDLMGLAHRPALEALRRGDLTQSWVEGEAARLDVDYAMIYDDWFWFEMPAAWVPAGRWTFGPSSVAGGQEISFYAIGGSPEALKAAVEAHAIAGR